MPSRIKGHIVQIWRPVTSFGEQTVYVDAGLPNWEKKRTTPIARTASPSRNVGGQQYGTGYGYGWRAVRREGLNRSKAIKLAKAYRQAGFTSRVLFVGNGGGTVRKVVAQYDKKD